MFGYIKKKDLLKIIDRQILEYKRTIDLAEIADDGVLRMMSLDRLCAAQRIKNEITKKF